MHGGDSGEKTDRDYGFGTTQQEMQRFASPLPDGQGLPPGSGTVAQGKALYTQHCVSCHGAELEGGIGDRLVGGRGTLANNAPTKGPVKTVESYGPYATTLVDSIKRAIPLTAPDSLMNDEGMRGPHTYSPKRRSFRRRQRSTRRAWQRCRCPTVTASYRIRGRRNFHRSARRRTRTPSSG